MNNKYNTKRSFEPGDLIQLRSNASPTADKFLNETIGCMYVYEMLEVPDIISSQFIINHTDLARMPINSVGFIIKKAELQERIAKVEDYNRVLERMTEKGFDVEKSKYPFIVHHWYAVYIDLSHFPREKIRFKYNWNYTDDWIDQIKPGIYLCTKPNLELCKQ